MYRICKSDRQPLNTILGSLPALATNENTPGYFSAGDVVGGIEPTHFSADWCNRVQEEMVAVILAAGLALSKTDNGQILAAIKLLTVSAMIVAEDQKAQGTNGGTFTAGAWRTRDLNTLTQQPSGLATLSANRVTLPAGKWGCQIVAPAQKVARHQARLQNITGATTLLWGTSENTSDAGSTDYITTVSKIDGIFILGSPSALEVQHQGATTINNTGFGQPASFSGATEVYTRAVFWRLG